MCAAKWLGETGKVKRDASGLTTFEAFQCENFDFKCVQEKIPKACIAEFSKNKELMAQFAKNKQLADDSVNMCSAHLIAMFPPCKDGDKKCWKKLEKKFGGEKHDDDRKKGKKGGKKLF